jgi:hypothetical protein
MTYLMNVMPDIRYYLELEFALPSQLARFQANTLVNTHLANHQFLI